MYHTAPPLAAVDGPSETPVARDCPFEVVQRHVGAEVGRLTRHLEMHVVRCACAREGSEIGQSAHREQVLVLNR